jgi:hypothetical protein
MARYAITWVLGTGWILCKRTSLSRTPRTFPQPLTVDVSRSHSADLVEITSVLVRRRRPAAKQRRPCGRRYEACPTRRPATGGDEKRRADPPTVG